MHRRDVLRLLATGSLLQLAPRSLLAIAREARELVQAQTSLRTLNPHQYATVKTMAELIIPRTDTPGATDVGVAEFIDVILTEWYDDAQRTQFLSGLADVDSRSRARCGKDFADCSSVQQGDVLVALGKNMVEEEKAKTTQSRRRRRATSENFYALFRQLTLTAYYTSEAGETQELHFEMIPDRYQGCSEPTKNIPEKR